jgi:hypothetical protein
MKPQLAQLPPSARRMVEGQMQRAMERLKMLTEDDAFEAIVSTRIIGVNQGPPVDWVPNKK